MFEKLLDRVSQLPFLWSLLRRIVEADFKGEKALISTELKPLKPNDQRLFLDFGCGTGEFANCFSVENYVGIDLSRQYLSFAQQTQKGNFVAMNGIALAFKSESFDAALVVGVLHHLPDQIAQTALAEIHRVLKPGAITLLMEDIPPQNAWNIAGHLMHWLDRGGYIRNNADYRALLGPHFTLLREYTMQSGICDYGVYVLSCLKPNFQ